MRRLSRCLPVLAALLAGGCVSSPPSTQTSGPGLPSDPTRAARQALAALSDRAFDERFTQVARLHLTGLAPAKAAKLNAGLRSVGSTETGVVRVTDVRDFEGRFTRSDAEPRTSRRRAAYGSLVKLPAGTSLGRGTITLDVSRAADLPMHMVDVTSLTTDLAALHRPGLSGRLITVVTSAREFTHLGSPS